MPANQYVIKVNPLFRYDHLAANWLTKVESEIKNAVPSKGYGIYFPDFAQIAKTTS
jgi:hypothetical protein